MKQHEGLEVDTHVFLFTALETGARYSGRFALKVKSPIRSTFNSPLDGKYMRYRRLKTIVEQSKHCPFVVNTTIEPKNITITPDNTGI